MSRIFRKMKQNKTKQNEMSAFVLFCVVLRHSSATGPGVWVLGLETPARENKLDLKTSLIWWFGTTQCQPLES